MNKKQLLEAIIKHYADGNKSKFASMLGITPQAISTWEKRNTFDIELIFARCENISAHWLLTGEGEMIKNTAEAHETHSDAFATLLKTIQQQAEEIGYLKAQINQKGHTAQNAHSDTIAAAG